MRNRPVISQAEGMCCQTGKGEHMPGWYCYNEKNNEYYTPWVKRKTNWYVPGPGNRPPTPAELKKTLDENPNRNLANGILAYEYDVSEPNQEPVDLPEGAYRFQPGDSSAPERLIPQLLREEPFVEMPQHDVIKKDIALFLNNEELYRRIGVQYRRGILMYGPPGEGKTSAVRQILKESLPRDTITIFTEHLPSFQFLKKLQKEEANRLKIFVFEELGVLVEEKVAVERLLDFLDGESSLDRAIMFATTNYPERLPGNIVDRPSRFDRLLKVGSPNAKTREKLLTLYLERPPTENEVNATKDLSTASVKEAALRSRLYETSVPEVACTLKERSKLVKDEFNEHHQIGLAATRKEIEVGEDFGW